MKKIIPTILTFITIITTACTITVGKVMAFGVREGVEAAKGDDMPRELIGPDGVFTKISNTILYIVGIVSVIMLIWGGVRYILSGGDSKKVTDAKNTILYAIIGLIISILAFAIVNFVLNAIGIDASTSIPDPGTTEVTNQ